MVGVPIVPGLVDQHDLHWVFDGRLWAQLIRHCQSRGTMGKLRSVIKTLHYAHGNQRLRTLMEILSRLLRFQTFYDMHVKHVEDAFLGSMKLLPFIKF